MSFVDQFDVILLDLNGTFMFGHDRFGAEQDYLSTYGAHGGSGLSRVQVAAIMDQCLKGLMTKYENPAHFDDFPALSEAFAECAGVTDEDIPALCATFASHELGVVPASHANMLHELSTKHQLGIVSNICSDPAAWHAHLDAIGLASAFKCRAFSSEGRSIKPSPLLFQRALAVFPDAQRVLFVGDSYERDIVPARALGFATAWISDTGGGDADCVIPSLTMLPAVT